MKTPARWLLAATLAVAGTTAWAQAAVKVEEAWARPTVAGQSGGGGFVKITGGGVPDKLVAARAGISKAVELHKMEMDGNVMRMRPVEAIEVPAGGVVQLRPGGLHIMFIGLNKTLKNGDSFPLTLKFEKAGEVKVEMKVTTTMPESGAAMPMHK